MSSHSGTSSLRSELSELKSHYSENLSKDEALALAVQAAELHMKFLKLATDKTEKAALSKKTVSLLDEAERIKKTPDWTPKPLDLLIDFEPLRPIPPTSFKKLAPPSSLRELSTHEQLILLKASKLNGAKFPPWDNPPSSDDFTLATGESLFIDPIDLSVSPEQQSIMEGWQRPRDAVMSTKTTLAPEQLTEDLMMFPNGNVDLVQDAASDCSVVASLAAVIARHGRGHARIMSSILFPRNEETGHATLSPNGKHVVKLYFNGSPRKVVIDDRLPVSKTSRKLYAVDRNNAALIWPAIVEKAYLKVRGGYDFPGSNSGTDLWVLTGWIPEQIFLLPEEVEISKLWKRIISAFGSGDVIITIGTGRMTSKAEKDLGLAGEHDYAVLDLKEIGPKRLLLIKNPWLKATAWRGYSIPPFNHTVNDIINGDEDSEDEEWKSVKSHNVIEEETSLVSIDSTLEKDLSPGTFWMDISDVLHNYESMYLNWNPGLFKYRQDVHFKWDLTPKPFGGRAPRGSLGNNPQFGMFCETGGNVWVVVSRHFKDKVNATAASKTGDGQGYINLLGFEGIGKRVYLSRGVTYQGPYVDSPQTLLTMEFPPRTPHTVVLSEQELPATINTFTLSAFSHAPLSLAAAQPQYACRTMIRSSWTADSSGGNTNSSIYSLNPQFSVNLPRASSIALVLESQVEKLHIHVKLLHSAGQRVFTLTTRDIVVDSGDYRRGCVLAELSRKLDAGSYTIICSTFTAGEIGDFSLTVDSDVAVTLKPIPKEGAGRLRTVLTDASFSSGVKAIAAPLMPNRLLRLNLRAHYVRPTNGSPGLVQTNSPLRVTIELGRGPNRQILIASANGAFSDATGGVRTEDVDLTPRMTKRQDMWLVLERLGPGFDGLGHVEERVSVEMFVDAPEVVDVGVWREWER